MITTDFDSELFGELRMAITQELNILIRSMLSMGAVEGDLTCKIGVDLGRAATGVITPGFDYFISASITSKSKRHMQCSKNGQMYIDDSTFDGQVFRLKRLDGQIDLLDMDEDPAEG